MYVTPYLHFKGRCEAALKFYEQALGAKINQMFRYKDAPPNAGGGEQCSPDPAVAEWIMHANFNIGDTLLMASDGPGSDQHEGFSLSLAPETPEAGQKLYDALLAGDGAQAVMPYAQTFWALRFGMVKDPFGVLWMINVFDPNQRG